MKSVGENIDWRRKTDIVLTFQRTLTRTLVYRGSGRIRFVASLRQIQFGRTTEKFSSAPEIYTRAHTQGHTRTRPHLNPMKWEKGHLSDKLGRKINFGSSSISC